MGYTITYDYLKGFKPFIDLDKELKDGIESHPLYQPKPLKDKAILNGFNETYVGKENNNKED